jgi:hypothetical protein
VINDGINNVPDKTIAVFTAPKTKNKNLTNERVLKMLKPSSKKRDWFDSAKLLLDNKNLGVDLGEQLHLDTQRFSIENVNKKRFKFLEQCTTKRHYLQPDLI